MKTIARVLIMPSLLLALAVLQTNLAAQTSSCSNVAYSNGAYTSDGIVQFTCNLYPSTSATTIDLTPNLTFGGADLYTNALTLGYVVVINGNPTLLSDDVNGLWNQSLWDAVLEWPGDYSPNNGFNGYVSDSLTVYYAGNSGFLSAASNVESFDQGIWGTGMDSAFFVQSGNPAVYAPGTPGNPGNDVYNVYPTPEPASALFLAMCLPVLAIGFVVKVKASGSVLHA
jgi:hypothetical protein